MAGDTKGTAMAINMKEIFKMERLMVKVCISGLMEKCMMENGGMESRKAMEYGKEYLVILTLASGRTAKQMVMVFINGRMATDTRVNGRTVSSMAKAQTYLPMGIPSLGSINMASQMDLVSTNGRMAVFTLESLRMDLSMARGNGRRIKTHRIAIAMKVTT